MKDYITRQELLDAIRVASSENRSGLWYINVDTLLEALEASQPAPTEAAPSDWSWVPRVGQRVRFTAGKREEGSVKAVHVPPHGNGIGVLPDGSEIPCICDPTQIEPLP